MDKVRSIKQRSYHCMVIFLVLLCTSIGGILFLPVERLFSSGDTYRTTMISILGIEVVGIVISFCLIFLTKEKKKEKITQ